MTMKTKSKHGQVDAANRVTEMKILPVVVATSIALMAACAKKNEESPLRTLTENERIEQALSKTFGGTYNRFEPENLALAARIRGASAFVRPAGEKPARGAPYETQIGIVLFERDSLDSIAITAQSVVYSGQERQPLQMNPAVMLKSGTPADWKLSSKYSVDASCLTYECDWMVAMLTEKEAVKPPVVEDVTPVAAKVPAEEGEPEGAEAVADTSPVIVRKAAFIFKRDKPEKNSVEVAAKAKGQVITEVDSKDPAEIDYSRPLVLHWSASPRTDSFSGGTRDSFEIAKAKAIGLKTEEPDQKAELAEEPKEEPKEETEEPQEERSKTGSAEPKKENTEDVEKPLEVEMVPNGPTVDEPRSKKTNQG